jgi:hypothetical protein
MSASPIFRSRWLSTPDPAGIQTRAAYEPTKPTKTLSVVSVGAGVGRIQKTSAVEGREQRGEANGGRLLTFDEDRLRRLEDRCHRTGYALAERYCPACGFSFWNVIARGDASCYACALLREGKPLRCAGCGGEEWRRDEHGRRACATCHGGDTRGPAPSSITSLRSTSRDVSAPGGAV